MPIPIEPYQLRVRDAGLPGARVAKDGTDYGAVQQGLGNLAQGASELQRGVATYDEKVRQSQGDAAVMDAYAKLSDSDLQLRDMVKTVRGKDAVGVSSTDENGNDRNQIDSALKNYETNRAAIAATLHGSARMRFERMAAQKHEQFNQFVNGHIGEQAEVAARDSAEAAATSSIQSATALARDIADGEKALSTAPGEGERRTLAAALQVSRNALERSITEGRGALDIYAQNHGVDAAGPALKYTTNVHAAVLNSFMEGDSIQAAKTYLAEHRTEIDADVLPKIEKAIEATAAKADGRAMALQTVIGSGVPSRRSWDPSPVVRPDAAKVQAELRRIEADPSVSDAVKIAYRENAEAAVRDQQQAFKSVLDATYTQAITKLERNGMRLSELGAEKEFLLDDKVQGGDVWRSIVGRAQAAARAARKGAHNSPDQDAAWSEFLFTMDQRKADGAGPDGNARPGYDNPGYTAVDYGREWGGKLSQKDLERGAQYIASMRGQAGKSDETLPPTVVRDMLATGARAGMWGDKGPKTDDENARRVVIERDLLDAQQTARAAGKPLDQATVDGLLKKWSTRLEVQGTGWFGTNFRNDAVTRAEYASNPDLSGRPTVDPNAPTAEPEPTPFATVPSEHREAIVRALVARNRPTTEEWVLWAWREANRISPNPLPANRRPAEPAPAGARRGGY